ncbi:MAG: tape measure protein, partial [Solirubrobacterales bacterium]
MPRLSLIVDPSGAEAGLRRAEGASDRYARSMGLAARATDRTVGAFDRMRRSLFSLQGAFGALGGALAVRSFVELSDAATQAENRLRVVTSSSQELARVQSELFEIAQRTRTEFTATADLYARLSLVSTELGVSQGEIAKFTEGVGQALAVTGTSAQQARGALIQLGQAVGSGIVRAEEFNSILEGAPRILQAVAAGMDGAGISVAELRNRVIDGTVSSREFFDAFTSQLPTLEREFAQT